MTQTVIAVVFICLFLFLFGIQIYIWLLDGRDNRKAEKERMKGYITRFRSFKLTLFALFVLSGIMALIIVLDFFISLA